MGCSEQSADERKERAGPEDSVVHGLFIGVPANTNLFLSNPEVRENFTRRVAGYAAQHHDADFLHVWLADE